MITAKLKTISRKEGIQGYMFVLPSLICLIFLSILPVILTFFLSFTKWNLVSGFSNIPFIGIDNYSNLTRDQEFLASLKNTLWFTIMVVPPLLVFGFITAVIINKYCYLKNIFKAVYFLPYISSTVAVATVWMVLFQPSFGPINEILKAIGIHNPPNWLVDYKWALPSLAVMYVWQNVGHDTIIYLAGLQAVPVELYESADIDGANWFTKITKITIPMVAPTTFFLLITEIIGSFRVFDQIKVVTEGGPGYATSVLVYYLYKVSFKFYKVGYGAAITMVLFVIVFAITFVQWKLRNRWIQD